MKTREELLHSIYQDEYKNTKPGQAYPIHYPDYVLKAMQEYADQFKPKWIPVSERLPDQFQYVDIWTKGHDRLTGCHFDGEVFEAELFGEEEYFEPIKHVTHWMPLPEKPEQ